MRLASFPNHAGRAGFLVLWSWTFAAMCGSVQAQDPSPSASASRTLPEGLRFANALLREKRYDLAADQFERFLKTAPADEDLADARFGLGRSRLFLNDYPAARTQFEEFLKIAPSHPNAATAAFRAGESAYLMNDLPAARKALTFYLDTYPNHAQRAAALPELGDACFKMNDFAGAKTAYETALAVDPDGRLANRTRFFLGRTLAGLKEIEPARKILETLAAANDPEWSGKARLQIGQILMADGKAIEAEAIFADIERLHPEGVSAEEARLRRAEAMIAQGKHDDAEALLVPLANQGSLLVGPPSAFSLLGSRLDRGKLDEALAAGDAAILRSPESPWVPRLLYRTAEVLAKQGKTDDARARFLKVATDYPKDGWASSAMLRSARLALDNRDPSGASALASQFARTFPGHPLNADAQLIAGRSALALDRPEDAVKILEALASEVKPGSEIAHATSYSLSQAYKANGQAEKASALLEELAKTSSPAAAEAKLSIALNQYQAKDYANAAESLEAYLLAKPTGDDAPRALAYLALTRQALGQNDAAKLALDRLAKDWPHNDALVRARMILAESALDAKQYDDAIAMFQTVAASNDPMWKPRALSGLGWAQLQGGHPEDAAATFAALLALAPQDALAADAALARGRALESAGKIDEALAALAVVESSYANHPEVEAAKVTRARLLARAGKPDEAAAILGAFLADHPKTAPGGYAVDDLLVEWGWTLHDARKPAEADAAFRRVIEDFPSSPRNAEARVFVAESHHAEGNPAEAEALLEPVVADGSKADAEWIQAALLRMAKIALARAEVPLASSRFDRLIRDFPDGKFLTEAQFGRAEADLKAGNAADAEARFLALTTTTGPDAPKWNALAQVRRIQCLAALEKWDETLKAAEIVNDAALKFTPSQTAEIHYARGRSFFAGARFADSLAAYQAAIDAAPATEIAARAQFMRGETYFHDKNYNEALHEFHKTELSYRAPEWQAAALLEAGKVYEALGRWRDAVGVYEKILASFPKDARIDVVNQRLGDARTKLASRSIENGPK